MVDSRLSIVIPVYNNAPSLPDLFASLDTLRSELARERWSIEEIYVDDGSTDDSLAWLQVRRSQRPDVTVVKLTRNFGAVPCAKTGLNHVQGDAFVIIAADLQDPPELIPEMARRWREGSKFVIAVRTKRGDPFITRSLSAAHYWLVRRLVVPDYPRGGFDMAFMDKSLLQPLMHSSKNTFTPLLEYWLGYQPDVIEYFRPARRFGKSAWSLGRRISASTDILLGFSPRPMRIMAALGLLAAALSGLIGLFAVGNALLNRYEVQGFATILVVVSFLIGLNLAVLALMSEYVWRLSVELNGRPLTVVEHVWHGTDEETDNMEGPS